MGNSYRRNNPKTVADFFSSRKFNETYFITSGTKRKRKRNEIRETKSFPRKMHIFLWGFLVVALNNLNLASSSDKVKNDGRENEADKSQLDMILAQLQRKHDKLQQQQDEQKKEQQLMNELLREEQLVNEVLRDQIQEQKHKNDDQEREMKEQRRKNDKQEREIRELTKIKRDRRSDGDIEDHLKELIMNETKSLKQYILNKSKSLKQSILNETYALIDGLSQCQVGEYIFNENFGRWQTISFERNFKQTPKVVASINGFTEYRHSGSNLSFAANVGSPTTTKFELLLNEISSKLSWMKVSWIACA